MRALYFFPSLSRNATTSVWHSIASPLSAHLFNTGFEPSLFLKLTFVPSCVFGVVPPLELLRETAESVDPKEGRGESRLLLLLLLLPPPLSFFFYFSDPSVLLSLLWHKSARKPASLSSNRDTTRSSEGSSSSK